MTSPAFTTCLVSTVLVGYVLLGSVLGLVLGDTTYGQLTVFKPDGTRLAGPFFFGTNGKTVPLQLPTTGTYSALLDPQGAATGSLTASL